MGSTSLLIDFSLQKLSKSKRVRHVKKHITIDKRTSQPHLSHVVRRTPPITYKSSVSKMAKRGPTNMSFSNTNTHNGGGSSFGRSAHIVNPSVVFHGKGTISAVQKLLHMSVGEEKHKLYLPLIRRQIKLRSIIFNLRLLWLEWFNKLRP